MKMSFEMGYTVDCYGVATISRLLKMIGLFCKRDLQALGFEIRKDV